MTVIHFSRAQVAALLAFIASHEKHDTLAFRVDAPDSEIHCPSCGAKFYFTDFTGQNDAVNGKEVLA